MTSEPAPTTTEARHLLASTNELTRRVRREQAAGWLPLLVFAVVTFAAIPIDRITYGHHLATHCTTVAPHGYVCIGYSLWDLWYWPVALCLAYVAISLFYLWRSRQSGLGTPIKPYVIAGVVLVVLATAWSFWAAANPAFVAQHLHLGSSQPTGVLDRIASPAGAIGLALVVLAWIERSALLFIVTGIYLVLVATAAGRRVHHSPPPFQPKALPLAFPLHTVLLGGVLLVGSIVVVTLSQRGRGRTSA